MCNNVYPPRTLGYFYKGFAANCSTMFIEMTTRNRFLVFMKMTKQYFTPTVVYARADQHVAVEVSLGYLNSSSDKKYKTLKN